MNAGRIKPIQGWNLLFGVSLLYILGVFVYGSFRPVTAMDAKPWKESLADLTRSAGAVNKQADEIQDAIDMETWSGKSENLGSAVLAKLSGLAAKHRLQLSNFRTEHLAQGPELVGGKLTEAPFVLVVEGSYSDFTAFVRTLERPENRLTVSLIQVGASDAVPGNVTATLSLVGFLKEAS